MRLVPHRHLSLRSSRCIKGVILWAHWKKGVFLRGGCNGESRTHLVYTSPLYITHPQSPSLPWPRVQRREPHRSTCWNSSPWTRPPLGTHSIVRQPISQTLFKSSFSNRMDDGRHLTHSPTPDHNYTPGWLHPTPIATPITVAVATGRCHSNRDRGGN